MDQYTRFDDGTSVYLAHHGVLGMKWGVRNAETQRRYASEGKPSRRTNRMAKKDAKEFARAKMYYGEGAGTRRKLIKGTVEQRKRDVPGYSQAFEKHYEKQDMAKAVTKAKRKRARTDAANTTARTGRGIVHAVAGNPAAASAAAVAIVGAARVTGMDKKAAKYAKKGAATVAQYGKNAYIIAKMNAENRKRRRA